MAGARGARLAITAATVAVRSVRPRSTKWSCPQSRSGAGPVYVAGRPDITSPTGVPTGNAAPQPRVRTTRKSAGGRGRAWLHHPNSGPRHAMGLAAGERPRCRPGWVFDVVPQGQHWTPLASWAASPTIADGLSRSARLRDEDAGNSTLQFLPFGLPSRSGRTLICSLNARPECRPRALAVGSRWMCGGFGSTTISTSNHHAQARRKAARAYLPRARGGRTAPLLPLDNAHRRRGQVSVDPRDNATVIYDSRTPRGNLTHDRDSAGGLLLC